MLIDTHVHLDFEDFKDDLEEIVIRAQDAGVGLMLNPGINLGSSQRALSIAERFDAVYAAAGIHPHDSASASPHDIEAIARLADNPRVVAIGECGLDFYRDYAPRDVQLSAFREQIRLARTLKKPLIVHSRGAEEETLEVLLDEKAATVGGVLHCFGGSLQQARRARKIGFALGFGGTITYPGSDRAEVVSKVVIDGLLLETDAPYLPPVPHRGRRNEPAWLPLVAQRLTEIGPFTLDDVHRITSHTARTIFGIGNPDMARIAYPIRDSLYLGITNRCTLSCVFCPKTRGVFEVKGHTIKLDHEPTVDEILESVGNPLRWREIVFCGYGETTLRLDVMKEVARRLRLLGVKRIRLDTDGLANFVHERDVTPELKGLVDAVSVSLNAPDPETYARVCRPGKTGNTFDAVKDFVRQVKLHVPEVTVSIVGMPGIDVEACRKIAEEDLGVAFRCREYNVMG